MRAARSIGLGLGILCAGGCATEGVPDLPPEDQPRPLAPGKDGCHDTAVLDGGAAASVTFGPYLFGTGTFCLRLDASGLRRAHLMAGTRYEVGTASGFTIEAVSSEGSPLAVGWDVTVGATDPMTFANLEMPVDGGTVLDVRLVVSAVEQATAISVALFDPLE